MRWDRLFDDLEAQASAEWEAERAALDAEAERVRIAQLSLVSRMRAAREAGAQVRCQLRSGERVQGLLVAAGADWCAMDVAAGRVVIVPLRALVTVHMSSRDVRESTRAHRGEGLRDRLTLGYVLRDLARRRIRVEVMLETGQTLTGTIDRAAADHCDVAVHDLAHARHPQAVTEQCVVPYAVIVSVRVRAQDADV